MVLTDRGRRCLSADPAVPGRALAEACWAVPLFHRVLEDSSDHDLRDVDALDRVLESASERTPSKSPTTARVLARVGEAGRTPADGAVDLSLVRGPLNGIYGFGSDPGRAFAPPVRWL